MVYKVNFSMPVIAPPEDDETPADHYQTLTSPLNLTVSEFNDRLRITINPNHADILAFCGGLVSYVPVGETNWPIEDHSDSVGQTGDLIITINGVNH